MDIEREEEEEEGDCDEERAAALERFLHNDLTTTKKKEKRLESTSRASLLFVYDGHFLASSLCSLPVCNVSDCTFSLLFRSVSGRQF